MQKKGLSKIELINSPLFDLIESSHKFCNFKISIKSLMETAKTAEVNISELIADGESALEEDENLQSFLELTDRISSCINEIRSSFHRDNREEIIAAKLTELERLNIELMEFLRKFSSNEDDLLQLQKEIFDIIKSEDVLTDEYQNFENIVVSFFSEEITCEQLNTFIMEKKKAAHEAIKAYDDFYLSEEEWTLETALGDRLLREGTAQYDEALDMIIQSCEEEDSEGANTALDAIYESYLRLIAVQTLADHTRNRAKII